jgi:hypothetical protein
MSDIPSAAAIAAFITQWREMNTVTTSPATATATSTPTPIASAPLSSAQLTSTPFSTLRGAVSSTRLAYGQHQQATQQVEREVSFIVVFYLQTSPDTTELIPNGIVS